MQAAPPELGPFFAHVKHQSHPSPKLLDLGIQMRWGAPRHSARPHRTTLQHSTRRDAIGQITKKLLRPKLHLTWVLQKSTGLIGSLLEIDFTKAFYEQKF